MHIHAAVKVWPLVARRVSGGTNAGGLTISPCAHTQGHEEEFRTTSSPDISYISRKAAPTLSSELNVRASANAFRIFAVACQFGTVLLKE